MCKLISRKILCFFSETALDFSHLWSEKSVDKMIKNAIPEVRELQLDYRKEVDRLLKMTCEAFIRESAHQVVGPLTSVIPKAVSFFSSNQCHFIFCQINFP